MILIHVICVPIRNNEICPEAGSRYRTVYNTENEISKVEPVPVSQQNYRASLIPVPALYVFNTGLLTCVVMFHSLAPWAPGH